VFRPTNAVPFTSPNSLQQIVSKTMTTAREMSRTALGFRAGPVSLQEAALCLQGLTASASERSRAGFLGIRPTTLPAQLHQQC